MERLRAEFLGRPVEADAAIPEQLFSLQSKKKDLATVAHRYTLGIQARGLHLNLAEN